MYVTFVLLIFYCGEDGFCLLEKRIIGLVVVMLCGSEMHAPVCDNRRAGEHMCYSAGFSTRQRPKGSQ